MSELNGKPVLLTPRRNRASSYPSVSQTSANTNGFETLCMENRAATSPISNDRPQGPTTAIPNRSGAACASTGM